MWLTVRCDPSTAQRYNRSSEQKVDVQFNETVGDAKVKLTLIYMGLETDNFDLYLENSRKLLPQETIQAVVKNGGVGGGLPVLWIRPTSGCCCTIF